MAYELRLLWIRPLRPRQPTSVTADEPAEIGERDLHLDQHV